MRIFDDYRHMQVSEPVERVVAIGNFDGVHLGHRAVLAEARRVADREEAELAVLTFEPHPAALLKPGSDPQRLIDFDRKAALLEECGADVVLAQAFDQRFAGLDAKTFVREVLVQALGAKVVSVGKNFHFGRGRGGDVETLQSLGRTEGFEVSAEKLFVLDGQPVSSSRIREAVIEGEVATAGLMLGRPHELCGTVVRGHGDGKGLGFPTANLADIAVLVPGPGIYAGYCDLEAGPERAAIYVGNRPTLGHGATVEAFLIDASGDYYGQRVVFRFVERVRGEKKFEDVEALKRQIALDVEKTKGMIERDG